MSASAGNSGPNFQGAWFGNIPSACFVSGIALFVMGWSYLYGYYSSFGVSLHDLSFEARDIAIFGSRAVTSWLYCIMFGIVVLLAAARAFLIWIRNRRTGSEPLWICFLAGGLWLEALLFLVALVSLVWLSSNSISKGRSDASCSMREDCTTLSEARLVVDRSKLPPGFPGLSADASIEGYLLLAHGRNCYYLFRPLRAAGTRNLPVAKLSVIFVPDESVVLAEVGTAIEKTR